MDYISLAIVACVSAAAGGGLVLWLKSRPVTTKAEAMRLLIAEAELVAKMPGAADAIALAQKQAKAEADIASELAAAMSKASGVVPQ